jgi:DNA repair exonuclease SbcCD ATPase subunit
MALTGGSDYDKLKQLSTFTHKNQTVWFLNAFWHKFGEVEAERLWKFVHKVQELDLQKHADGNELDELNAHRFLEHFKETMTVTEMRDNLKSTGAIVGNIRMVPIIHILIFRYKIDWKYLVNAAQGDNKEEIEEAQRKLDEVQRLLKAAEDRAQEAKAALRVSESKEAEAKKREAEARQAQQELEAALAELKAQEDAFNNKTKDLQTKSEDQSVGLVTRNKAKAELAQHLSSDPLPLRRAKITQEAAVKKAEKATAAAAEARSAAEAARRAAEEAKRKAEAAVDEANQKVDEAEAYLQEVKSRPGAAQGALWWIERELKEARAYLPERKGGYRKQN